MVDPGGQSRAEGDAVVPDPVSGSDEESMVDSHDEGEPDADPREVAVRALQRSMGRPFRVGFVLGGLLAAAAALLVIQNGESARINWLWMEFSAPLWLVLLLTLVAGGLVWETLKMAVRRGRRLRQERREALHNLRAEAEAS